MDIFYPILPHPLTYIRLHSTVLLSFVSCTRHSKKPTPGAQEMDRWMDGWMGGWIDGWVDGWMDGWVDG